MISCSRRLTASSRGRLVLLLASMVLLLGVMLSTGAVGAQDPPEPTKEPAPTTITQAPEPVTTHMTEDGQAVVIIFLKEQPLHEASTEVRAEYEPEFEALRARMQAAASKPWEGQSFATVEEEREAVRNAPQLSAAQQDELKALSVKMDALGTEMRREMLALARPHLEASRAQLVQAIEDLGGQILHRYTILNGVAAAIPPEARMAIEARPDVAEVVDDRLMTGHLNISVPSIYTSSWWNDGYDGGVWDIGIVDSGIDDTHPGLSSQSFCERRSLAAAGNPWWDPTVDDVNGHGTHVAGIVASTSTTYRGVAYGLHMVFNCKAGYDDDGSDGGDSYMYWADAMSCVDWALVSNTTCGDYAEVLNLSYGGSTSDDDTSFARFWDAVVDDLGIPSAISAGNSGPGPKTVEDPSIAYNVLCVANMDDKNTTSRSDDTIGSDSSRGPTDGDRKKPDITAPGTDILSANNTWEVGAPWVPMWGTSMAAPHVAGANLLMVDYFGIARPLVQKAILINTAEDRGDPGWDATYGWGYIDLDHAYFHIDDWFKATISPSPDYDLYKGYAYKGDTATLVWHRRVDYAGDTYPNTYYTLSDLDLHIYREDTGDDFDSSVSGIDNVEQVKADGNYPVVVKVEAWSTSFDGASTETYALATEEDFSPAVGPVLTIGTSHYTKLPGDQWTVNVTVYNSGDLAAHEVLVSLSIPSGLSLTSGANPQNLGTISAGGNKTASWILRVDLASIHTVPVSASSSSYGETYAGSGSFLVISVVLSEEAYLPLIMKNYSPRTPTEGFESGVLPPAEWIRSESNSSETGR